MPKRVTAFELMLSARDPKTPAYRWIYGSLRTEILEGRLRPGSRLPSSRDLALQYRLSRGTIVTAFEQLKSEGYIEGTIGSGSYVSKVVPEQLLKVGIARAATPWASQARQRSTAQLQPFRNGVRRSQRNLSDYAGRLELSPPLDLRHSRGIPGLYSGVRPVSDDIMGQDRGPEGKNSYRNPVIGLRFFRIPAVARGYRRLSPDVAWR